MTDIRGMSLVVNFGGVDVTIRVDDRGQVYPVRYYCATRYSKPRRSIEDVSDGGEKH